MTEGKFISSLGQGEVPEYQSPERIAHIVASAKAGDIVHIVPQGEKRAYLRRHLGIEQIHGCVIDRNKQEGIALWSTYFTLNVAAFDAQANRTYAAQDIRLIVLDKAEEYIQQASGGKFDYLSEATVRLHNGLHLVRVDSYYDGIVSGLSPNGQRITGGASFFTPA